MKTTLKNKSKKKKLRTNRKSKKIQKSQYYWGLGVEHEMQIFHKSTNNENIIFDSQEAACFVSHDTGESLGLSGSDALSYNKASACCKLREKCFYHPKTKKDISLIESDPQNKITKKEKKLLLSIDWELSGRNVDGCNTIVTRVPRLMPELVTGNFKNRTIQSIANESIEQENTFMTAIKKSPFTREKIEKYGELETHLCGTVKDIKVPITPTIRKQKYKFMKSKYKDYVGSYHITLTIPTLKNGSSTDFIKLHKDTANQIQWLEPLLLTAFFTGDPDAVADLPNERGTRGSYRIVNVGWGNLAGSDVRTFNTTGVNRGNNIKSHWRNGLRFKGLHKLEKCVNNSLPQYEGALSILTSDFRTFGEIDINDDEQLEYCETYFNPFDCPKLDGNPMYPPYGMEIRIFDHFPSAYLLDLMKIITLIAANAKRFEPKGFVYENKHWINQLKQILKNGWTTDSIKLYIKELNKNLGLKIDLDFTGNTYELLCLVIDKLFLFNKNSVIVNLLDETPYLKPEIPQINRLCWEMVYKKKLNKRITDIIEKIKHDLSINKNINYVIKVDKFFNLLINYSKLMKYDNIINKQRIGHQKYDIIYALENLKQLKIIKNNQNQITHVELF